MKRLLSIGLITLFYCNSCDAQSELLSVSDFYLAPLNESNNELSDSNEQLPERDYRGSKLRLGAFALFGIDAELYFGPEDIPLALPVSLERDLGFKDSTLAARGSYSYRFSKHHALTVGYYKLSLDGVRRLSRNVEIGDIEFDIGINVESRYEEDRLAISYDFIFHDEGKVALSTKFGMHFTNADFSIGALAGQEELTDTQRETITAPLPMLGGRVGYRFAEHWTMALSSDIFFLTDGTQEGSMVDSAFLFEYQSDGAMGAGIGINRFALDLDLTGDGNRWDWRSVYSGAYMYVSFKF